MGSGQRKKGVWAKMGGTRANKWGGGGVRGKDGGSGQRKKGSWAKIVGTLGLSKDRRGLGKDLVASAGPCTLSGGDCKAAGVAEEPWRTWLGWRRRAGMGGGAGGAGGGPGCRPTAGQPGRAGPGRVGGWTGGKGEHAGAIVTSGMCPKRCKCCGVKNARRENLWAKEEGVWAKNAAFRGKKITFVGKEKYIHGSCQPNKVPHVYSQDQVFLAHI